MKRLNLAILSLLLSLLITLLAPRAGLAVIAGDDGRVESFAAPSAQVQAQADASVAIFDRSELLTRGSRVRLKKGETLGEYWNLCPGQRFRNQPTNSFCSGTLVGPDLILTAGHCVTKSGRADQAHCRRNLRFVFGYKMADESTVASISKNEVYECKEVVDLEMDLRSDSDYVDFAVIRLSRRVKNHTPLAINRSGLSVDPQASLTLIGHPAGIPQKIALGGSVKSSNEAQRYFTTSLDSMGGNSGSPVINEKTGLIEGVLGGKAITRTSPGDMDFVVSPTSDECLVENQKPKADLLGDVVTRISEAASVIPAL